MAGYSYRRAVDLITDEQIKSFEEKHNVDFDHDPGMDGDYWQIAIELLQDSVPKARVVAIVDALFHEFALSKRSNALERLEEMLNT